MSKRMVGWYALNLYLGAILLANWMIGHVGRPVPGVPGRFELPVGFGLWATSGTYAAALVLVARDLVQRTLGRRWGVAVILPACLMVALLDPRLGLASGVSFLFSELVDYAVYTPLAVRGLARAVFASACAGSVVDSVLFLSLAGIPLRLVLPGLLLGRLWVAIAAWAVLSLARPAVARLAS